MKGITIRFEDGGEAEMPKDAAETQALKSKGVAGKFSVQTIKLAASSVGISPAQINKLIDKIKASVKGADKKDA